MWPQYFATVSKSARAHSEVGEEGAGPLRHLPGNFTQIQVLDFSFLWVLHVAFLLAITDVPPQREASVAQSKLTSSHHFVLSPNVIFFRACKAFWGDHTYLVTTFIFKGCHNKLPQTGRLPHRKLFPCLLRCHWHTVLCKVKDTARWFDLYIYHRLMWQLAQKPRLPFSWGHHTVHASLLSSCVP